MKHGRPHGLFLLLLITIVGLFLRVYKVDSIPPSLSWDEASIGYNAWSILTTGRDEHGRKLPIDTFKAFGDYKPPIPIYLTVPAVALLGLNEFAVRLPSAIFGTLTVLLMYFLVKELFNKEAPNPKHQIQNKHHYQKEKNSKRLEHLKLGFVWDLGFRNWDLQAIALLSALLLALSPWHIQLSRAAFEANIALFFIVLGIALVLAARNTPRLWVVAWLPFVLSVYTFNSSRFLVPLLVLGLLVYCRKALRAHGRYLIIGSVLGLVLLLPIVPHLLSKEARLRFAEVNIFTDLSVIETANDRIAADGNTWWSRILHNRRIGYGRSYLTHFFDNVEPRFLFIRGDGNPKFSLQDVGQLYIIEAPFLLLGIFLLFSHKSPLAWFLLYWLIASIIPAATARETPHALRIENSLPVWVIVIAYALISNFKFQISNWKRTILFLFIVALYLFNFSYFWHNYFNHYAKEYSGEWQYGYREAVRFVQTYGGQYQKIVMTESIGRPYIYVLFYTQFDPVKLWNTVDAITDAAGIYNVYGFERYRFVREGISRFEQGTLYILRPQEVPAMARVLSDIKLRSGNPVLTIFDIP